MEKISSQELRTRGENLVLERVRGELFEKYLPKKEKYKHVGGSLYNTAKFLFYVFSVWYFLVIIKSFYILSCRRALCRRGQCRKAVAFCKRPLYDPCLPCAACRKLCAHD